MEHTETLLNNVDYKLLNHQLRLLMSLTNCVEDEKTYEELIGLENFLSSLILSVKEDKLF